MDRARTVSSSLYRSKFFHKLDLENYKQYIVDQCNNNKPFKYEKLNEYVSGVIDGENIKIIFSDGSKQQTVPIN
jgi:vacuolar-type H+-ATPase subunit C/Vma6